MILFIFFDIINTVGEIMKKLYCTNDLKLKSGQRKILSDLYELAVFHLVRYDKLLLTECISLDDKVGLVERVSLALEKIYSMPANICEVNIENIKDLKQITNHKYCTNEELIADKVYRIENVYEELKKLKDNNNINIYNYPERPLNIPKDDSDLIDSVLNNTKLNSTKRKKLSDLLLMHPNLIYEVNYKIINDEIGNIFTHEELINNYEKYLKQYSENELDGLNYFNAKDYLDLVYYQYCNAFMDRPKKLKLIDLDYKQAIDSEWSKKRLIHRINYKERQKSVEE